MNAEQVALIKELNELHQNLQDTDYKVIRYQGRITAGLPTKLSVIEITNLEIQRDAWRTRINEIEVLLS